MISGIDQILAEVKEPETGRTVSDLVYYLQQELQSYHSENSDALFVSHAWFADSLRRQQETPYEGI